MKKTNGSETRKDLTERIEKADPVDPMPLVHVTNAGTAYKILHSARLEARHCDQLGLSLVFFFVGRAAYKSEVNEEHLDLVNVFPVVFVVKPESVTPSRVHPFDTGAALKGMFKCADPTLGLRDYQLKTSIESAFKHITWAFGSRRDYFEKRLRSDLMQDVDDFDATVHSFAKIARLATSGNSDENSYDDRASAIEVAVGSNVDLKDCVELAIVPDKWLEGKRPNKEILDLLKFGEITVLPYKWAPGRTPEDFKSDIEAILLIYMEEHYGV